jgi:hypothetical protein
MKSLTTLFFALPLAVGLPCAAQPWEVGGAVGYGSYRNLNVTSGNVQATAGFDHGLAFSVYAGDDLYRHLGGEFRYTYRDSDLKLKSGGTSLKFGGDAHAFHYDFLFHPTARAARVRPYIAAGAGIKLFRGTERESPFQPLSNVAVFTRVTEVKPLISVGAGVRAKIARNMSLRLDVRDYITPFPTEVLVPVPPARLKGWLHDFVPMVGIGIVF